MNTQEILIMIIIVSGLIHVISYELGRSVVRSNFVDAVFLGSLLMLVLSLIAFVTQWLGGIWY
jgi:hypothetical protein